MSGKERFTRRDALLVLSTGALATLAAPYIKTRAPHYQLYIDYQLKNFGRRDQEGKSLNIFETYDEYFNHEYESGRPLPRINMSTFSQALKEIAFRDRGEKGLGKLTRFIRWNPLRISFQKQIGPILADDGTLYEPDAGHVGTAFGGPLVIFSNDYLRSYFKMQRGKDLNQQIEHDKTVWHELIHFWQDAKNVSKHMLLKNFCTYNDNSHKSLFQSRFCPENNTIEEEALVKSKQIIHSLRAGYISGRIEKWPFGHFFSIQQV